MLQFPPPSEGESASGLVIPEHDLLRCIGRGSYGQVWLARNRMGVYRAVKVVFRSSFESEKPFARELSGIRKFEPVSRLHEGFIDVLQVGINAEEGYFYYVMELGDDVVSAQDIHPGTYVPNTLGAEIARRGSLSAQECLQLGLAMTHALAELHKHGLVHRDVKPSNVIFVNGKPKLADIGLVADLDEARSFVGTEGFVPPDGPGTAAADLFSLGKVLYEASTGKDRNDFPELPSEWTAKPDYQVLLELNEVIIQACDPDRHRRYQTAWDMHGELLVIVGGKSVKRLRLLEKRLARIKRVAVISAALLLLTGLIGFQIYQQVRSASEERRRKVSANLNYGNQAVQAGDLIGALPSFAEALRLDEGDGDRERAHRLRFGSTVAQSPKLIHTWFVGKEVEDVEFSPDGKNILLIEHHGCAQIHEANTGELVYQFPFGDEDRLRSGVYSPDGRYLLFTTDAEKALIWDPKSNSELMRLPHPTNVFAGKFSPDSKRVVTACKDGYARVWEVSTGQLLFPLEQHTNIVSCVCYSPDGRYIGAGSRDGTARIYYAFDGHPASPVLDHNEGWVNSVAFSPDNQRFLTTCDDRKARVWEAPSGKRILPDLQHSDTIVSGEYSKDGRIIATSSWDYTVRLWRATDLQPIPIYPVLRQRDRVYHVAISPDCRRIAAGCSDGTLALWDLAGAQLHPPELKGQFAQTTCHFTRTSNDCVDVLEQLGDENLRLKSHITLSAAIVQQAHLTPAGDFVLILASRIQGGETNTILQVRKSNTGELLGTEIQAPTGFGNLTLTSDETLLAASNEKHVRIWNIQTGNLLGKELEQDGSINFRAFIPGSQKIVICSGDEVDVWDPIQSKAVFPRLRFPVSVRFVAFDSVGQRMITCCTDDFSTRCFAQVWDLNTGLPLTPPLRHADGVLIAAFSPDGKYVLTGSEDFTARIWDARTGAPVGLPLRHSHQVQAVSLTADGFWVATGSADYTARVWDAITGEPITPPLYHPIRPNEVRFTKNMLHLVTGRNGTNYNWPLPRADASASDLIELAEFFTGGNEVGVNALHEIRQPPQKIWPRVRKKFPDWFSVDPEDVWRWHDAQVKDCESDRDWNAAVFHLERMCQLKPGDSNVVSQLKVDASRLNH